MKLTYRAAFAATAALALAVLATLTAAAPLQPAGDDEIVEVLPLAAGTAAEQRRLRRALALAPRDALTALALSRHTLERARQDGDARLAGQALGVLSAWDGDAQAPVEIRLQRATLLQHLHRFDASAAELEALLAQAPRHPQALLTLATVRRVQGRLDDADRHCLSLMDAGQPLLARACVAENRSLRGGHDEARREFDDLIRLRPQDRSWAAWLRTSLGELELRAGRNEAAITQLRGAFAAEDSPYTRHALVDALIEAQRWAEARQLLGADDSDAVLLRRAIVARQLASADADALRERLDARFEQAARRPEQLPVHARERSRFALEVVGDAARAVSLGRANLQTQREATDFVVMHRAAKAADDQAAVAEVLALARQLGLRDARLTPP